MAIASDNSGASRTARVEKWVDNSDNEFTIRSMDGNVSRCTIEPWLTYDNPKDPGSRDRQTLPGWGHPAWVDANPERLRETAPRVRCDNLPMGGAVEYYKGGCIFSAAKRVLVLNSWNYDYGQVARHIQTAFTKPSTTVPFKTDGPKHIPGNRNAGERTPEREPLTRILSSSSRYSQNRTAKDKVCKEFFSDRPLESNGAPEDEWQECDEYPFASTKEGGAYDHPEHRKNNFSVQAVLGRHNSIAGSDLGVFFARYRVLNGNKFWVAVR
ncbi:hypothetical protein SMD20_39880 [Nonomuraea sp. LP-02]|uniref:NucA/NucB deoxyribonuclease domain-containing protein n=1 Tax=Nonomuraea sp. LP-02 TaxID=3097960 RepID=UPI002E33CAF1|nr:hypothetical protein [Nonomuraea sp. LP-02]MED7930440.1 hypothetical protein [Nonomuraea sp. LP-02]